MLLIQPYNIHLLLSKFSQHESVWVLSPNVNHKIKNTIIGKTTPSDILVSGYQILFHTSTHYFTEHAKWAKTTQLEFKDHSAPYKDFHAGIQIMRNFPAHMIAANDLTRNQDVTWSGLSKVWFKTAIYECETVCRNVAN